MIWLVRGGLMAAIAAGAFGGVVPPEFAPHAKALAATATGWAALFHAGRATPLPVSALSAADAPKPAA